MEVKLYNGEIIINFYEASHRYKLAGQKTYIDSVTAITGIVDKSRMLIPWAVGLATGHLRGYLEKSEVNQFSREELLPIIDEASNAHNRVKEEAATQGSMAHDFAEKFARAKMENTELPELPEEADENVINAITGFHDWYLSEKVEFLEVERFIYSVKNDYCGKFDAVCLVNGVKTLIEYKTSKAFYPEYYLQASAYVQAYNEEIEDKEEKIKKVILVNFGKETGIFETVKFGMKEVEEYSKCFNALNIAKKILKNLNK